jgi:hypothetical protein
VVGDFSRLNIVEIRAALVGLVPDLVIRQAARARRELAAAKATQPPAARVTEATAAPPIEESDAEQA